MHIEQPKCLRTPRRADDLGIVVTRHPTDHRFFRSGRTSMQTTMMRRLALRWACACMTVVCSAMAPVAQATTASATLFDIQFQVSDLAPDDGQVAGFDFASGAAVARSVIDLMSPQAPQHQADVKDGWLPETQVLISGTDTSLFAATGALSGLQADVHTTAINTGVISTVNNDVFTDVPGGSAGIWIAPQTSVVVSARYHWGVSLDGFGCVGSVCETAIANVNFGAQDLFGRYGSFQGLSISADPALPGAHSFAGDGEYSFTLTNASNDTVAALIFASVWASGFTPPAPVPEPATWLTVLAGLGVLGGLRRRGRY
ncbi:PEP-CTERM sorting domain-containing protein [Ideonella sp. BN130291]|uniref:PEP-CTERM sorting domain-containing protein n=1 Tax=Ideonella sp. BN130291 TaxID=3112940 RepID=UPI002E26034E|nr:PEP-CTERM sorting domain-containing protein [Ideonella sp. BN130291]